MIFQLFDKTLNGRCIIRSRRPRGYIFSRNGGIRALLDLKEYGIVLQNNKSVPYARINIIAYTIARRPNKTAIGKIALIIIEGNSHSASQHDTTL